MDKNKNKKRADEQANQIEEFLTEVLNNALTANEDSNINDLYDVIMFKNRTILLDDIKSNVTGSKIYQMIMAYNLLDEDKDEVEPIKIYSDSWGGSLIDGFEIIDAIKTSRIPVYTYVTGAAYSCGLLVAIAGDKRMAYPHSSFLLHEGSVGSEIQDAHKFKKYAEFYNVQLKQMKDFILENTHITEEEYNQISKDDNWYTAAEALEKGFIDEVIT